LPTDPHYQDERGGWVWDDEEEGEEDQFEEDQFDQDEFDEDEVDEDSLEEDVLPDGPSETETDEGPGNGKDDELPW
jgi:hypothetical protein